MDTQTPLDLLWRRKWLILTVTLVTFALSILLTLRMAKTYQAAALIQVNSASAASTDPGQFGSVQQANQALASSYATVVDSPGFLERVRPSVAGGHLSLSSLESRIGASAVTVGNNEQTNLIKLTARGGSPANARRVANDVANAFVTSVRHTADNDITRQQRAIESQIAKLNLQIASARNRGAADQVATLVATRNQLEAQRAVVIANGISRAGNVYVASPPTASSTPVSPRPLFNAVIGLLLGFLLGIGLAWLRERLDVGLHSSEEAEKLLDLPNLATIPLMKGGDADTATDEAYDVLRTNLVFLGVDHPLQVVTFTSYNAGEGKSSAVVGLARAAHRSGAKVLIVDSDLRTGSLTKRVLGANNMPGLTNLIVADGQAASGGDGRRQQRPDPLVPLERGLSLLPAGPLPPNPTGLLSSKVVADVVGRYRGDYDLILIDSPPVANLADASLLAALSDAVVLVARIGTTTRKDLTTAAANLRHSPTPIVGAVVFDKRAPTSVYYPSPSRRRVRMPRPTNASIGARVRP
jgi:capsular exopolysaccharide synthesis family protein